MNETITSSNEPPVASDVLEITWARALPVWWGFTWRATVFLLALALALGILGALLSPLIGESNVEIAIGLIMMVFYIPLCVHSLGVALRQQYAEFSIKFVRNSEKKQEPDLI